MESLLNPLASQDHIPLGITWVTSQLLELVAALFYPVPLGVIVILKDPLVVVEGWNLLSALHPVWQKLLHNRDQGICLVTCFAFCLGHLLSKVCRD
jgi:hypothetical protein